MTRIIEGKWEELVGRQDLRGRQVQVIVLEDDEMLPGDAWLKALHAWANSHKPLGHIVDDSRESIYSGTIDDPR